MTTLDWRYEDSLPLETFIGSRGNMMIESDVIMSQVIEKEKQTVDWFFEDDLNSEEKAFFDEILVKDSVVMDGGAYIGDSTSYFLKKGCIVYAFEPQPIPFKCMVYNCPEAVSFNQPLSDSSNHTLRMEKVDRAKRGRVKGIGTPGGLSWAKDPGGKAQTLCLDDFLDLPSCALIKLDVQGFEPFVIKGAQRFIEKFKPALYLEEHAGLMDLVGSGTLKDFHSLLDSLGYDLFLSSNPYTFYNNIYVHRERN